MKNKALFLASVLLLLIPFGLYVWMDGKGPSDLGSLLGAFCGLLAIIWFYRGLRLQSIQIDEQRKQFTQQMHLQHQDSLLAFLNTSSERMERYLSELLTSLNIPNESQVTSKYLSSLIYYKQAIESSNPNEVLNQIQNWIKIEGPCVKFLSSVRDIIVLHRKRSGMEDNSEGADPADYVFINGAYIMDQPFLSAYKSTVNLLSEQMMLISPGRKAMALASSAALSQIAPEGVMKKEKIIQDIKKAISEGLLVPKICDALYTNKANSAGANSRAAD
jgi:hypothetical protein